MMKKTMPIKYYLQPNPITPDPNYHPARATANVTLTEGDIVEKAIEVCLFYPQRLAIR
jgi:hypothetical protein